MFLSKLQAIRSFVLDVDGVLTDATVHVTESGEQLRTFNVRDGYAIKLAIKHGFPVCAISGGTAESIALRLNGLGITEVYLGIDQKQEIFQSFLERHGLNPEEVVYMGDDIPDLPVMKIVGVPVCPADAVEEVKSVSIYISPINGGYGCVREIIEKVLKVQGKWYAADPSGHDDTITSA